jgi:hypothetical protein
MSDTYTINRTVDFSSAATVRDGMVYRRTKIFEAGEYPFPPPQPTFAITADELATVPSRFTPVYGNDEHNRPARSVLRNKLGVLTAVEAQGSTMYGTFGIPEWLDKELGPNQRGVSLEWSYGPTKDIVGWGWTEHPRIPAVDP